MTPSGAFTVSSYYIWDTSNLYTTGEVTFTGTYDTDFNDDNAVDGADFLLGGMPGGPNFGRDLANWKVNFGQTSPGPAVQLPEPPALPLAAPFSRRWRSAALSVGIGGRDDHEANHGQSSVAR